MRVYRVYACQTQPCATRPRGPRPAHLDGRRAEGWRLARHTAIRRLRRIPGIRLSRSSSTTGCRGGWFTSPETDRRTIVSMLRPTVGAYRVYGRFAAIHRRSASADVTLRLEAGGA
ncbi:hypothetical protein Ae717Ps2_6191 [Pseudonocardia sp. Ae717_Ps2]|nr:hypothetical protein Ae717Ps2_6191 [Pseudonocardia sp. Ae717_Ps2]